ncbi:PepSY domain-containing protein [Methanolobus profundi]|uniref:Peptidase propeptide and YPEB domain-containing protein n=1 Tax=Methanolobus profundi TaxID=487685 RepID=A0A1I4NZ60_9EURY|nr:PepSY domain-containing protein [Methanolobus profundi]SFM20403.1 hypothetical protein SAMN04488696_0333 [Methanolobus profundi]
MKRTTSILLAGMLIAAIAGIGIVSAAVDDTDETFFGQMSRWAGHGMMYASGYANGYGYADCPVYGSYAADGTTVEIEVETADEAIALAESVIDEDVEDIYQMNRWWVFTYTEDDTTKQGRIDAYTGEVIEDFYTSSSYQGQYYQGGRGMRGGSYGGYGGCGGAGYRY